MAVRMAAGRMNRRIELQRATMVRNSLGEEIPTWAAIAEALPAEVTPLDGAELFASRLEMAEHPTRFRFRYASDWAGLTTKDRILVGSVVYDLVSIVIEEQANKAITCVGVVRG